jgi:hypothetical protein
MSRRAPSAITQFGVIIIVAVVVYLLLLGPIGTAAGYVATAVGGVLVGLYLPLWTDRTTQRVRVRTSRWGWWR